MGYFSNGTEGEMYYSEYCMRCLHNPVLFNQDLGGCAVWGTHLMHNYDECNNEESILHLLIPRDKDGNNEKCLMFYDRSGENG